jgi:hypothetical protein
MEDTGEITGTEDAKPAEDGTPIENADSTEDAGPTGAGPSDDPGVVPRPGRSRARRLTRRALTVTAVVLAAALVLITCASAYLALQFTGEPIPSAKTRGRDAVWLGHSWVDGREGETDLARLAGRLDSGGFSDVFVHVGPLDDTGRWDPALAPRLSWFLDGLRRQVPSVRIQAWLGNVVAEDRLDLSDSASQQNIEAAVSAVLDRGADGVHFDFEPIAEGDRSYLHVLEQAHALTAARGAMLSVAVDPPPALPGLAKLTSRARPIWWSPQYLGEVARRVEQVALMTYDSALPSERLYGGTTVRQVEIALDVVPPDVDLLVGLPAYHVRTFEHHPRAETVAAAVRAARLALAHAPSRERFGVSIYADFSANEEDWTVYRREWQGPGSS